MAYKPELPDIGEGVVEADDYERLRRDRCVTQAYLVEGRNRTRV
mgnify:CR=1 FL=1